MKFTLKTAAAALALTMLAGTGSALAKAHDQGVADGEPLDFPGGTGAFIQTLPAGVSSGQNDGQRGGIASTNGGDNAIEPVVGANEPD